MRFVHLSDWLAWQETLHPTAMDLGLQRVRDVAARMNWPPRGFALIAVAGTNGKGSTVAYLESITGHAGHRVGSYTSPHLIRYNERIRIDGKPVCDEAIVAAFAALDAARGDITLTYFEFGTLAAMHIFLQNNVDVAVLEVGIGGRLDAVNVFDADVAVVTTIALDHQKWLGETLEEIGAEKAGIFRQSQNAIASSRQPPDSIHDAALRLGARLHVLGEDFDAAVIDDSTWNWWGGEIRFDGLPVPPLVGAFQLDNAAGAIAALLQLPEALIPDRQAVVDGLRNTLLRGRFECLKANPSLLVDVGHNAQAIGALAVNLERAHCPGRSLAVVGMLTDKDAMAALRPLAALIDAWFVTGLEGPRGDDGTQVRECLERLGATNISQHTGTVPALEAALDVARPADRVIAFGSFYVAGDVIEHMQSVTGATGS
jgi:dihydrofolate synthase/folylpolyglutamate synthase